MISRGLLFAVVLLPLSLYARAPSHGRANVSDPRASLVELVRAQRARDTEAWLSAFESLVPELTSSYLRTALESYGALGDALYDDGAFAEIRELHRRTAALLRKAQDGSLLRVLDRERTKSKSFRVRALLLDLASLVEKIDLEKAALDALEDKHPVVIRRALHYLAKDRKPEVVFAIVKRFEEVEKRESRRAKASEASEWSRAEGAFHEALAELLGVRLPSALDWRVWVDAREKEGDLFRRPTEAPTAGRTAVSLFGAQVTGKNIVFVLDVSGSMVIPDPRSADDDSTSGRTVVGGAGPRGVRPEEVEERRRITRAKRELEKVVRALPEDVRFNVIPYSSDVKPWKASIVPASAKNKDEAVRFVRELVPSGVTVTDLALEEALADLDVDTVYLLTDGAPTHLGSAQITSGGALPEDSEELMAQILSRTTILNFLRGVRIHCLGFRGAHEEFLKKLASENSGEYRPIP